MDELEKHIRNIRDELDIHEPGQALWSRIEAEIKSSDNAGLPGRDGGALPRREMPEPAGRRIGPIIILWRAAVAVIVAGAAFAIIAGMLVRSERLNDPRVATVRETYRYYDDKIKDLYTEAGPLLTANPEISTELTLGMSELDRLSAQIISDMGDNIASSEVVEALISNYRLRIELLEDMLRLMRENEIEEENINGNGI